MRPKNTDAPIRYHLFPFKNLIKNKKNSNDNGIVSGGLDSHRAYDILPYEKVNNSALTIPIHLLEDNSIDRKYMRKTLRL